MCVKITKKRIRPKKIFRGSMFMIFCCRLVLGADVSNQVLVLHSICKVLLVCLLVDYADL